MSTVIIGSILFIIIVTIVVKMRKDKIKRKSSCGCSCSGCPMGGKCHSNTVSERS